MRLLTIVLLVVCLLTSGCAYLTPPIRNVSGADIRIEKRQAEAERAQEKRRRITVRIRRGSGFATDGLITREDGR